MSRGRDGNGLESGLSPGLYLFDLLCSPLTPVRRGVVAWTLILGVLSSECLFQSLGPWQGPVPHWLWLLRAIFPSQMPALWPREPGTVVGRGWAVCSTTGPIVWNLTLNLEKE